MSSTVSFPHGVAEQIRIANAETDGCRPMSNHSPDVETVSSAVSGGSSADLDCEPSSPFSIT